MSDLPKQAGILSATEFFRLAIKSIIGIALARIITPAELGSYRQLFLIYTTFSTLLLLGIPQSMLYFLPKAENAEKQKHNIYTHFNPERNELFFARKALLVEGDSDKILFSTLCENKWNIN